jgi:DNA-binding response OmpR family regulator
MRVLVAEDEKEIRNFLKSSLESECYSVDTASDGETALNLAHKNVYDLFLFDNIMPRFTGKELCKKLRLEKNTSPILMLSVKSEVTTKVDLLNAGADDYLTKPFSIDELLARMKALLRRPTEIKNDIYRIDDLVLDNIKHLVTRSEEEIYLAKKEFSLLLYLLKNKGTVLSRSMIMENVWGRSTDPFSNTIEAHIRSLRNKIDINGKKKLIHTITGRGYKIDTNSSDI